MIVRILGEGPYEVPDEEDRALGELDGQLEAAIEAGDQTRLDVVLGALLERVRAQGRALPADDLRPSDLVLPHEGSTVAELRALLAEGATASGLATEP
ncbi:PspA-associated protein PspAA [Aciditerrimonas ferrireducens]|uniref:PspA-associated protein PspAA n=1 Tax=Aciditerrimonas ferrireducens TaxID=667306 RepID=UPI0020038838|nr:hypothetical protein [Aciditerrimonas ferrireducens]MCK4176375.1 hypothetical protein [Aciditerrimonas ferrireducens]